MAFAGTTQKCMACDKTVYLVDKLTADNRVYHKACFRCHHCKGTLKLSNYNSFEGVLYCRPHFDQLFKRTGSLDKSFEGTPKIVKPERPLDSDKPAVAKVTRCTISPSNYIAHEGRLYCKHHHTQLIREKGNLSQLEGDHASKDGVAEKLNTTEVAAEI
ncbi:hypothetical protein G4B88_008678 [Cannabis sativa]|uniref:LIM zinc-binding domain-containing protein n=1 Tax=Cannabis sativa TaxID=3483 RepID=A0A7J6EM74_CANSA|nr:hypothetical protein G4B88_008678 [Cannabis sativa]